MHCLRPIETHPWLHTASPAPEKGLVVPRQFFHLSEVGLYPGYSRQSDHKVS